MSGVLSLTFRETSFDDVEHVSSRFPLAEGGETPRPRPRANRMTAPPTTTQKLLAEALGTAFLVFVGAGSAAATGVIAAGTKVPFSMAQLGMISFAFMLVIVGAVYAIGHISGGHINPAVTLSLAVSGKFPWREVPGYIGAQVVGAVVGAAAIFLTLGKAAAVAAGGGVTSYNSASMGFGRASLIEAIGTFMLVFVIFGGMLGGLAYVFIGRVRADAAMTSLAPDADPVPEKART